MGHQTTARVVLEVGPEAVRRVGTAAGSPGESVHAALAGIDDPVVLLGERPVAVADLWRGVIESALGESIPAGGALIVHPSCWTAPRVGRVVSAARSAGLDRVAATSRCAYIAGYVTGVVVELDAGFVSIGDRHGTTVLARRDVGGILEALTRRHGTRGDGEVFLDAPRGGNPMPESDAELLNLLIRSGIRLTRVDLDTLVETPAPVPEPRRVRRVGRLAAAVSLVLAVAAVAVAGMLHRPVEGASLVEGRVAVRIPPRWDVERITAGPGSRRVQVRSQADPDTALQITQSYVPESTLADAADALRRAVAGQPPGIFVDLRPTVVAGRDTVSYREIRPGRVIRWSVLLDGATRIAIGCQSAAGREGAVAAACTQAIGSAREYGTETGR